MKTLADLRKTLKPLGFKISTKAFTYGVHVTYKTIDGQALTYNVFTPETREIWRALFEWQTANAEELAELKALTGLYGLNAAR